MKIHTSFCRSPGRLRVVALGLILLQVLLGFHALQHGHRLCREHGEWVESHEHGIHQEDAASPTEDGATARLAGARIEGAATEQAGSNHIHCPWFAVWRHATWEPLCRSMKQERSAPMSLVSPAPSHARTSVPSLRLAQKTSPPRLAA